MAAKLQKIFRSLCKINKDFFEFELEIESENKQFLSEFNLRYELFTPYSLIVSYQSTFKFV